VQEGVDRGNYDAGLDRQQFDPDDRNARPDVDDDALVEDAVEYFCQTR